MEEDSEAGLNAAQARMVMSTFTYVSKLLDDVLQVAGTDPAPFGDWRPDLTPVEARDLMARMRDIRARMLEALAPLGIAAPEGDASGRWVAQTALLYADIALSELTPDGLRRYGVVDDVAGRAVDELSRELRRMVADAQEVVRRAGSTK